MLLKFNHVKKLHGWRYISKIIYSSKQAAVAGKKINFFTKKMGILYQPVSLWIHFGMVYKNHISTHSKAWFPNKLAKPACQFSTFKIYTKCIAHVLSQAFHNHPSSQVHVVLIALAEESHLVWSWICCRRGRTKTCVVLMGRPCNLLRTTWRRSRVCNEGRDFLAGHQDWNSSGINRHLHKHKKES